jgi:hypothetical protein
MTEATTDTAQIPAPIGSMTPPNLNLVVTPLELIKKEDLPPDFRHRPPWLDPVSVISEGRCSLVERLPSTDEVSQPDSEFQPLVIMPGRVVTVSEGIQWGGFSGKFFGQAATYDVRYRGAVVRGPEGGMFYLAMGEANDPENPGRQEALPAGIRLAQGELGGEVNYGGVINGSGKIAEVLLDPSRLNPLAKKAGCQNNLEWILETKGEEHFQAWLLRIAQRKGVENLAESRKRPEEIAVSLADRVKLPISPNPAAYQRILEFLEDRLRGGRAEIEAVDQKIMAARAEMRAAKDEKTRIFWEERLAGYERIREAVIKKQEAVMVPGEERDALIRKIKGLKERIRQAGELSDLVRSWQEERNWIQVEYWLRYRLGLDLEPAVAAMAKLEERKEADLAKLFPGRDNIFLKTKERVDQALREQSSEQLEYLWRLTFKGRPLKMTRFVFQRLIRTIRRRLGIARMKSSQEGLRQALLANMRVLKDGNLFDLFDEVGGKLGRLAP